MSHALQLFASPGGPQIADWTYRAKNPEVSYNEHGDLTLTTTVPMGRSEALYWYDHAGLPWVELTTRWGETAWQGRLEDVTINDSGISITAYGAWQATKDIPYTALWSDTSLDLWRMLTLTDNAFFMSDRFEFTLQNSQIRIAPRKGEVFGNTTVPVGVVGYEAPDDGSRLITGITFDYELTAPANWRAMLQRADSTWTGQQTVWTITSAGTPLIGTARPAFGAGNDHLTFSLFRNAADATFTGETGTDVRLVISNIRVLTSTARSVSTTLGTTIAAAVNTALGTAIAAGTRTVTPPSMANIVVGSSLSIGGPVPEIVTVTATTGTTFTAIFAQAHNAGDTVRSSLTMTPASMAGIYAGQRLQIGATESVLVSSVTSTTFTAPFTLAHANTDTVIAALLYGDTIAVDVAGAIATANPGQISTSTGLIQSPGVDLLQRVYEDKEMGALLTELAAVGDSAGQYWEVGVDTPSRALYLRPRGSAGRTWYVRDATLEVVRTLDQLANSVYATYTDANNRTLRTPNTDDAYSISRYGVTRRQAVKADTTDAAEAGVQRGIALSDKSTPIPRAKVEVKQIYDASGQVWPVSAVRSGDTIELQLLPAGAGTAIDRIRTFRVSEVRITASGIEITPEAPTEHLSSYVLRVAERFR